MGLGTKKQTGVRAAAALEAMESRVLMSYAPAGDDFSLTASAPGNQGIGAYGDGLVADAAGNFVVTYGGGRGGDPGEIFAARFDANGNALGAEFRVNTTARGSQSNSSIAMSPAGDFVIVWMDDTNDTSTATNYGIYGQRFNAQGVPQGAEFRCNTTVANMQMLPSVGMDDAGNFVVVWHSNGQDVHTKPKGTSAGIYGQRFSADGARLGGEFAVNTYKPGTQNYACVAMDGAGNFVVSWKSSLQDGSGYGIYAQRFGTAGQPLSGEFRVNDYTTGDQEGARVGMGPEGFTVIWRRGTETASDGVYAKRYTVAANGTVTSGAEFRVDAGFAVGGLGSEVAYDASGNSLITWSTHFDSTNSDTFAQEYDPAGNPVGGAFRLNSTTEGKQFSSFVAFQPGGNFVAAFRGPDATGGSDVFARRFIRDSQPAPSPEQASTFSETPVMLTAAHDESVIASDPISAQILA